MTVNELIELLKTKEPSAEIEIREMTDKGWVTKPTQTIRQTKTWSYISNEGKEMLSLKIIA